MAKVITISGPSGATDAVFDLRTVRECGFWICSGCDSAITADSVRSRESQYCARCEEENAVLEALYRAQRANEQFSQQPQIVTAVDTIPYRYSASVGFFYKACAVLALLIFGMMLYFRFSH